MNKRLSNKIAIVTGGARGIGKGIVKSLLINGAKVIFFDLNEEDGEKTENELNAQFDKCVTFFKGSVSSKKDNEKVVNLAISKYGRLDILCANAGIYPLTWIKDITEKLTTSSMSIESIFNNYKSVLDILSNSFENHVSDYKDFSTLSI